jgi:Flp pilus assembly protein TadG
MDHLYNRLLKSQDGAAALEFALIAPLVIALMLGVFQVSLGMNNYNAMRSAADDMARYSVVKFQDGTRPDEEALTAEAREIAISSPYNLRTSRLDVDVELLDTSRVAGALEAEITMTYTVPSVMAIVGMDDIETSYTRSVFLID